MGGLSGGIDNSHADKHDAVGTGDDLPFRPFPYLPPEIRISIWKSAAEAAMPQGVYRFSVNNVKLGLLAGECQVSQALVTNMRRLRPDGVLARDIRELMQSVYIGDTVTTFDPLPDVDDFTRDIRNLLGSCPEARYELMRTEETLRSSFSFHWVDGGKCDLGVIRPFCYDTDWIGLTGMSFNSHVLPAALGNVCTPDLARIKNVSIPFHECSGLRSHIRQVYLQSLPAFPRLKSLGMYEPCFSVDQALHWDWDRLIRKRERFFLKGVPTSVPDTTSEAPRPRFRQRLTRHSLEMAMASLRALVQDVELMARYRSHSPGRIYLAGLQFCFLLHATTQEGLDLLKFKEDGSHLGDVARIEDLGKLGRQVKHLQVNGRDTGPW